MATVNNYIPPMKMVVDTDFTKFSGERGGTRMFSRKGKQTVAEDLTFQPNTLAGSRGVQSIVQQQIQTKLSARKEEAYTHRDDENDNFDNMINLQQEFQINKNKNKNENNRENTKSKTKKKENQNEPIPIEKIVKGNHYHLKMMFDKLQENIDYEEKIKKAKKGHPLFSLEKQQEQFVNQHLIFKSNVPKFEDHVYKLHKKTVSLNDGNYRVNYDTVDPKVMVLKYDRPDNCQVNTRFFHIAPCVMNSNECTYQTRKSSKDETPQVFNSVIQIEEKFFKNWGLDSQFKNMNKRFKKKIINLRASTNQQVNNNQNDQNGNLLQESKKQHKDQKQNSNQNSIINNQQENTKEAQQVFNKEQQNIENIQGKIKQINNQHQSVSQGGQRVFNKKNPPEHLNMMYGSYFGFYSKHYTPSFNGTFKSRMSTAGTLTKRPKTREPHNQKGLDPSIETVVPNIHSPIKFNNQRKREVFHRRDGCLHGFANEKRFTSFNDMPEICSKFEKYQSPAFQKWSQHSVSEFIKNYSNCADENATHQNYNPCYSLVEKDLSVGLPDFNRFISKEQRKEVLGFSMTPDPYDQEKLMKAHLKTQRQPKNPVPFNKLMGRDNLYEKMHGLPKQTKEEMIQMQKKYENKVDYREFLPNSIVCSPKNTNFSNTFKTNMLKAL